MRFDSAEDRRRWRRCGHPPFATREKINRLRRQYGHEPLSAVEYAVAKETYEQEHPSSLEPDA